MTTLRKLIIAFFVIAISTMIGYGLYVHPKQVGVADQCKAKNGILIDSWRYGNVCVNRNVLIPLDK